MSCNITATSSCAVECMEPGRAQTEAQSPTITSSNDKQPTTTQTPQRIVQVFSSPPLEESRHNDRRDNTHNHKECLNQLAPKMADMAMNGSDNSSGALLSKTAGSVQVFTQSGDLEHPVTVMSTQPPSPPSVEERLDSEPIMIDEPDPRLLDALQKPIDRPLILKLEQDVIAFITGVLDSYDTTSLNSYHRMLVHKIAEFYRLTHIVSPEANDCVRLFRGHAARIPPIKLSDMANAKSPPDTPPSGPQVAVKIMRRKSPSQHGSNGEMDQSGSGKGNGKSQGNDSLKQKTREEKEAAYQLARARIFGDFKESPPESPPPPPSKKPDTNEKQASQRNNKDREDGFQSRSQYYPVSHPFQTVGPRFASIPQSASGFSGPPQSTHTFNPAALSFNPNASSFITSNQPRLAQQMINQQYPVSLPHGGGYPQYASPQPQHMPFPATQPNYGRPPLIPNAPSFNGPPTAQPQLSQPQPGYGSNFVGMRGFSPMGAGFVPSTNNQQATFNRTPDPYASNGVTYPPNLAFAGHQNNSNILSTVNGTINGGWSSTKPQQGRFQQGEGPPLADGLSGKSALHGAGRG